ncbi:uncharacterized protein LOC123528567 [Mercenaria mercenaria]|uniref:uncharacterized protein LOC123528567 n=1 Tax=Mercenaria mercenaria TaxID=6596 RepID=UPI00234F1A1F|nr:uncharacterized protein LOC123528567 [Mercenaria mercenaria]
MAGAARLHFGIDLVDQAMYHVAFIKAVNNNAELRKAEVLKRAAYRYEKFWLPLAVEHPREYLSAPMDIEWVWHCHMLSPKAYETDCQNVVRSTVNHTILRPEEFQRTRNKAHAYWTEKYTEPFYIDYSDTYDKELVSKFTSKISYDIIAAAERQRIFYYQVSLPHYQDRRFLERALERYKKFLLLKRQYAEEFLVPCYDIDLIWHTHQLNPLIYKYDTTRIVGHLFNHDDSVNERHEGSKLNNADKRTRELWKQVYNESFSKFGAMFRGNPPSGNLYAITQKDEFAFCTKYCIVSLDQLTLHMPSPDLNRSKHVDLKASSAKISRTEFTKWFKLKRPANSRPGNPTILWTKVGSFNFDTSTEHGILFSIQQKSGMFGSKSELDSNFLDLIPLIESPANANKPGGILKSKLTFKANTTLEIQGHYQQPKIGVVFLFLIEGSYKDEIIPDTVQQLLGPVAIERLPPGSDNSCKVATHKLRNHLSQDAFMVRTIHSVSLMTSVIHVSYQHKLCSVAHLIAADQLPLPTQVNHDIVTINPKLGERAVLIKNNNGDWGIVCGKWTGLRKGVPPTRDRRGIPGCPGTLRIKLYKMATGQLIQTELPYLQKQYKFSIDSARVDLKTGILHIDPQTNEVAENIALAFSISLLHVLCVPRPKGWKEGEPVARETNRGTRRVQPVPSDSLACVKAAGLITKTPSNHYIASQYGSRFCAMCFGGREDHVDIDDEWDNLAGDDDGDIGGFDYSTDGEDAGCGGCGGCGSGTVGGGWDGGDVDGGDGG